LRSAVKKEAAYYTAPASLAARIRKNMPAVAGEAKPKHTPRQPWFPLFAAVAATAVISWTVALQIDTGSRDERIAEQVIAGHARATLANHLTDVASSDQHTVKPWLSSKLDFSPPAIDLAAAGFPLAGARLDYVDRRPVAALVYRHRQHVINLFVWPADKAATASMQASSKQGFNMLHWSDAGLTYWAISDLNPTDIKKFAETYAAAN
jgi:anti-sigma factor RsiW